MSNYNSKIYKDIIFSNNMTRRINIKVGSIVLREEPELFTGKLCVVPSQNFDNG